MDTLDIVELTDKILEEDGKINKTNHKVYMMVRSGDFIGNIVWNDDCDSWCIITDECILFSWEIQQINYFITDLMTAEKGDMN